MSTLTVLLVEDDLPMQLGCQQALQLAGLRVQAVDRVEAALKLLAPGFAGVVVTDMRLPGADGLSLVRACRDMEPELPVIMITGHGDVSLAVEAMRSGAYDFIPKPFSPETLVEVVRRALDKRALTLEVAALKQALARQAGGATRLVGRSPQMRAVRALIERVAGSDVDVLVRGETGTGKELVAQALHELSGRAKGPLVALNCGGLPDTLLDSELFGHEPGAFTGAAKRRIGKIEHAHKGTLFLDEVESMPMPVQVKLLRVLQDRVIERLGSNERVQVDCRVIAATKDDLLLRARDGSFRADLVYRLNVVTIELPPLRERREDIPLLLEHFLLLAASRYGLPMPELGESQRRALLAHDWPGNVRELRNVADSLVLGVPGGVLGDAAAPADGPTLAQAVEDFERGLIREALRRHGGHLGRSAQALKVPKTTLADKLRKYGLNAQAGSD
ncbi:sigma-54-dependent Fis family transcriptional regulator [Ideonella sp. 4Y16]|uniref:Sigma-54-dependent Fis family transcriptional regulator n=1 Tax=Ideonella alba TaxID=2824118 RepID=A0A940YG42_9BURK|nr:sigma-54 dependent transcriptional regulator [Ideonella alba]MBQ0931857.1 sigma-54-dependent Fis family transcriptional regulator [Ideonella alba]MBQ0946290.1 sigma-54-dependent Fis family transcriptional regulator [Ideonella alba]